MSRKLFTILFVVLAVCFVPVRLYFGIASYTVPAGWGIAALVKSVISLDWRLALVLGFYSLAYIGVFCIAAWIAFFLTGLIRRPAAVWCLQILVLAALFCFSFARVITYSSIQGKGGTYTLWTAAARALEKSGWR